MLNIKSLAIIVTTVALSACDAIQQNQEQPTPSTAMESCNKLKIDQLLGFDEQAAPPQCKPVKDFNLVAFKCEISKNAFGATQDAAHIENEAHSIFAYPSEAACRQGLQAHDANAH